MKQSRLTSMVEALLNVFTGFFISWAVWVLIVAPLYGFDAGMSRALGITSIFTVSSLLRSYVIRRVFNNGWNNVARRVAEYLTGDSDESKV